MGCIITYILLCIHNVLFVVYSVSIYSDHRSINMIIGTISIIFGIFEAFIIFIYYIVFNIIFCVFHDNERTIGEFEYTLHFGGKHKKYASFFNYLYVTLELIVNVPMMIILLFYLYKNDIISGDAEFSWYLV